MAVFAHLWGALCRGQLTFSLLIHASIVIMLGFGLAVLAKVAALNHVMHMIDFGLEARPSSSRRAAHQRSAAPPWYLWSMTKVIVSRFGAIKLAEPRIRYPTSIALRPPMLRNKTRECLWIIENRL